MNSSDSFLYPHLHQHDDHDPHAGGPPKWEDLVSLDGNQGGWNDGGLYAEKGTNEKWYVKFPDTDDHAHNETLAAKLYRACKIKFPETWTIKTNRGLAVASRWVHGLRRDQEGLPRGKYTEDVGEGMAVDAWLANWDQVGIGNAHPYGNMPIKDGKLVRIDPGGALLFRGTGGAKRSLFTDHVTELKHYQSGENPKQTSVYGHVKSDQIANSILKVLNVTHADLENLVKKYGPGSDEEKSSLIQKLKKRQKSLAEQYQEITGREPDPSLVEKKARFTSLAYTLTRLSSKLVELGDSTPEKLNINKANTYLESLEDAEPSDEVADSVDDIVSFWFKADPLKALTLPLDSFYEPKELVDMIFERVTSPELALEAVDDLLDGSLIQLSDLKSHHEVGNVKQVYNDLELEDRSPMLTRYPWLRKFIV